MEFPAAVVRADRPAHRGWRDCAAAPPKTVELIVFPGGFNWPSGSRRRRGCSLRTASSKADAYGELGVPAHQSHRRKFDIAMTAIDNLIAIARTGRGTRARARFAGGDGGDTGFLRS